MIGAKLKRYRRLMDMKMETLAEMAGISKAYLKDLEEDKSEPSLKVAANLADALGCSVYYFLGRIDYPTSEVTIKTEITKLRKEREKLDKDLLQLRKRMMKIKMIAMQMTEGV